MTSQAEQDPLVNMEVVLAGARLVVLPAGALWWPEAGLLAAGDLHLGRAERVARLGGGLLPPYETGDTLHRLSAEITRTEPRTVVLLGDSFDDMAAADGLCAESVERLMRLAAGRRWIWVAGNHDPGPAALPGSHREAWREGPLVFRHIADPGAGPGEISAHYHPKACLRRRGQRIARACFVVDRRRMVLPAFGTYTGGLDVADPVFDGLFEREARALLTGTRITALPRLCLL